MKRAWRWVLLGLVGLLVLGGCGRMRTPAAAPVATLAAGMGTQDFGALDSVIEQALAEHGWRGAGILIMQGDTVLHEQYFGAYSAATVIPIASGSKWLAAATIMTLVDAGKLQLDDPVSMYLPEFSGQPGQMTLRQLLSHTSGMVGKDGVNLPPEQACLGDRRTTLAACVEQLRQVPLEAAPGTQFDYSGAGFQVAGRMAEVSAGQSWADIFEQRMAAPLGMTSTTFGRGDNPRIAGGVSTSMHDYAQFLRMLLHSGTLDGQQVLAPASVAEMERDQTNGVPIFYSPQTKYGGPELRYGLGVWRTRVDSVGNALEVSSPGAFGFTPWIDREHNLLGILMVVDQGPRVYPVAEQLKQLTRTLVEQ